MSGQKGSSKEAKVPLSIVFITIGAILLLTVGVIWLLLPGTIPASVYTILQPLLPDSIILPTPASLAAVPIAPPAPQPPLILPETAFDTSGNNGEDNLVTMAEALAQEPLTGKPIRIVIPAIDLDAPVADIGAEAIVQGNQIFYQWLVPTGYMAGWHNNSARLGQPGNTVLNGHHNVYGEVFRDLIDLEEGDEILMYDEDQEYEYQVTVTEILPERGQDLAVRLENAQWIAPTEDERITLVTCWPYTDNSHRLIVVAEPMETRDGLSKK